VPRPTTAGRVVGARAPLVTAVALVIVLLAAGCAVPTHTAPSRTTIALLLPEVKTARYEQTDRPVFEDVVARQCPTCLVIYANANQDAARQQEQAESALTQGAGVLVLDAVDAAAAASIVAEATARHVPVIAYDRFLPGSDVVYYVSFDNRRVGQLQGEALVTALAGSSRPVSVLMVNGAATDSNSDAFKDGARIALAAGGVQVLAEYDTPDWSPDKAQDWVAGQITLHGSQIAGVYAANDGTAGGSISAMKAAGRAPVPPVTGQDAELAAVQRIVSGDQYMTVYKSINRQATTAADVALQVLSGQTPASDVSVQGVPASLLSPVAVTAANVKSVLVDGGVYTVDQICEPSYVQACKDAGLLPTTRRSS
jgi:D-xylose transport system substrate-binding protein